MTKELWTIGRMLQWTEQYFLSKGIESSRLDGEVLLSHMLGVERIYLYTHFDQPLTDEELNRFRPMVIDRTNGLSVATIIGEKDFMGLTFKVSKDVLIPRPDTETLVEAVLQHFNKNDAPDILDVCSGSGAILLSLLSYLPNATGIGLEKSLEALAISRENSKRFLLDERGLLIQSDLFSYLEKHEADYLHNFDVIVSNPPYIPSAEIKALQIEVQNEPVMALDGGTDGLDFYRVILTEASKWLKPQGILAVEIGYGQEEAIAQLATNLGCYSDVVYHKDLGGINRVLWWTYTGA